MYVQKFIIQNNIKKIIFTYMIFYTYHDYYSLVHFSKYYREIVHKRNSCTSARKIFIIKQKCVQIILLLHKRHINELNTSSWFINNDYSQFLKEKTIF